MLHEVDEKTFSGSERKKSCKRNFFFFLISSEEHKIVLCLPHTNVMIEKFSFSSINIGKYFDARSNKSKHKRRREVAFG